MPPPRPSRPVVASSTPEEQLDTLVVVLDLVRTGAARTRPQIVHRSGLGRTLVAQRVAQLIGAGLLAEETFVPSTGGRPARDLRFTAEVGAVLVAELGATSIAVALSDLTGELTHVHEEPSDIAAGPDAILGRVEELFDKIVRSRPAQGEGIWGIGVGLPGPVEYAAGRPVSPPIMPGWDGYPVRDRLSARYDVPTWVDNDVNLMALGELRAGLARGVEDVVFVKIGSGIGAGLISGGRMHRGAQGAAGDVGHVAVSDDASVVCRCGNVGCLEAVAGGAALAKQGTEAARDGRSEFLADRLRSDQRIEARDVADAAARGDAFAVEALGQAGRYVGGMVATLLNFFNPALVIIGGGVAQAGDLFLAAIRQAVYQRSLPLATRDLRISRSQLSTNVGLHGAAFAVIDELFSRARLPRWIEGGTPAGRPDLAYPAPAA